MSTTLGGLHSANFLAVRERIPIRWDFTTDTISYGADNLYPQRVEQVALRSGLCVTALNVLQGFTQGQGWEDESLSSMVVNSEGLTMDKVLRHIAYDYSYFNAFALHIQYNLLDAETLRKANMEHIRSLTKENEDSLYYVMGADSDFIRLILLKLKGDTRSLLQYACFSSPHNMSRSCIEGDFNTYMTVGPGHIKSIDTFYINKQMRQGVIDNMIFVFSAQFIKSMCKKRSLNGTRVETNNYYGKRYTKLFSGTTHNVKLQIDQIADSKKKAVGVNRVDLHLRVDYV